MLNRFVIRNTKQKLNINQAIYWFDCNEMTIMRATRYSERGAREQIYILGAMGSYGVKRGSTVPYVTDTGMGYGGKGQLCIEDILTSGKNFDNKIMSTCNIMELNENIKLPIWVFK